MYFFLAQVTSNTQIPDNFILSVILKFLKKKIWNLHENSLQKPLEQIKWNSVAGHDAHQFKFAL